MSQPCMYLYERKFVKLHKTEKRKEIDAVITNKLFQFSPLHQTKYTVKNNEKKRSLNCFYPLSMSFDSDYSLAIEFILYIIRNCDKFILFRKKK